MPSQKSSLPQTYSAPQEYGRAPARALDTILEACWLLTAVLAPLWINLWSSQPFDPAKAALLRSLVWFAAGLWLVRCLLLRKNPLHDLRHNPLLWPAVAVAAVLLASTFFALDPRLSLFGSYTRGQGLLTLLSYVLLFFVVSARLQSIEQARRLLSAILLTAVPLIALGAAQAGGLDPLGLVTDTRSPVYATLGRSNFVGAYMAMLLPLTLALLLHARARRQRVALAALLLGEGALIVLTFTRAPLLAAGAGLLAFAFFWLWPRWSARQRVLAAGGALLAGLASILGLVYHVQQVPAGSVAARRAIWGAVWELIGRRPVLGYGSDSLELIFPRVYPPELVYYQGRDLFVDRAHNLFLDWTVATGLLGATALTLLLGAFFLMGLRRLGRANHAPAVARPLLAASLAAVAANLAGNLVSFDVTATAVASWLLMALAASPALATPKSPAPVTGGSSVGAQPSSWLQAVTAGLMLATIAAAIVYANGRPLLASVDHRQATLHAAAGDWPAAISSARRAVARWPAEPEHHRLLGHAYLGHAVASGGAARQTLARAEAAFLSARDLRPQEVAAWSTLGHFYHEVGAAFDPHTFPLAHSAYRQAVALAPHYGRLHVAWAQVYLAQDQADPATQRLQRAVALDATDGLAFRLLGDVTLAQDDPVAALESYRQAVRWSPGSALAHLGLARSYWALGQPANAVAALERAVELDAHHPAIRQAQEQIAP